MSESVTVLGLGEFGGHVAALLRDNARWPVALAGSVADAIEQGSGAAIVAMWRPYPAACEEADALAVHHQRPWLPVVMDHPNVRVGPVVVPGQGACFGCFTARQDQHDSQASTSAMLRAAFDRDPELGPRGYLDHHARLAAALAQLALGDLGAEWLSTTAGQVLSFNVYGHAIRRHPVIARSGCSRCGPPAPASSGSAIADVLDSLAARREARYVPARGQETWESADGR